MAIVSLVITVETKYWLTGIHDAAQRRLIKVLILYTAIPSIWYMFQEHLKIPHTCTYYKKPTIPVP